MARINTNIQALMAQRGLARSQRTLGQTLERLSSGLKINRGADNPAGLIASEGLRSEIAGINQAIDNSTRASNVIATTEANLNEVASLLTTIKQLVVEAANSGALSDAEIGANQLQIDSAIASITRISNTAQFAGLKLLNGQLGYITSQVDSAVVESLHIHQAQFGTFTSIPVNVNVITSARTAQLAFATSQVASAVTLEIAGNEGVTNLSFTANTTASAIMAAVNQVSDATGVSASLINSANAASGISFKSIGYGSKEFVSVRSTLGTFVTVDTGNNPNTRAVGVDAVATVNGALSVADGLNLHLNTSSLDLDLTLNTAFGIGTTSFAITGGGAKFQLGPQVNSNQQISLGIESVAASHLGDGDVGFLSEITTGQPASLTKDLAKASKIIERAVRQVAVTRGRLGAFEKNTLDTNVNSLNIALENVTASESKIRDADFAYETSQLTRAQILTQAGTAVLATANSSPQTVLQLLQR